MSSFKDRFNELLQRTGIDATTLAMNIDVSKQTISAWKTGVRSPKKPALKVLAEYFNVSLPWLCGLDVPMGTYADPQADQEDGTVAQTPDERRLIVAYRQAEPKYQEIAMELLEEHPKKDGTNRKMA